MYKSVTLLSAGGAGLGEGDGGRLWADHSVGGHGSGGLHELRHQDGGGQVHPWPVNNGLFVPRHM